jgi:hypothetical protein
MILLGDQGDEAVLLYFCVGEGDHVAFTFCHLYHLLNGKNDNHLDLYRTNLTTLLSYFKVIRLSLISN